MTRPVTQRFGSYALGGQLSKAAKALMSNGVCPDTDDVYETLCTMQRPAMHITNKNSNSNSNSIIELLLAPEA